MPMTSEDWLRQCSVDKGRVFFENVPRGRRPAWAAQLLRLVSNRANYKPLAIEAVLQITSVRREWHKAHDAFSNIRSLVLEIERRGYPAEERLQLSILSLAELVAKTTYNASGAPAPFDEDSGWYMAGLAAEICNQLSDPTITDRVWQQLNTAGAPCEL